MDINTRAQQDLRYPAARRNEKGCLQVWGGDALLEQLLDEDVRKNFQHFTRLG
jgi:hypothetical protein